MGDRRNHFAARAHHDRAATQSALQLVRRAPHRRDRISFYHRLVASHGRSRFFFVSNFRHHSRDAALNMPRLPYRRLDGAALLCHGAFDRRDRLHRLLEWRHDLAGSQDGIPDRLDPEVSANRDSHRHTRVVHRDRADSDEAERVRHGLHSRGGQQGLHLRLQLITPTPADFEKDSSGQPKRERLAGAQAGSDTNEYFVFHKTSPDNGPAGRYLVNDQGSPVYLVDPGINGIYDKRPDGSSVQKFTAPKATLMSYIIKGILGGQLPWGLVLLGVFISIVLELSGIPSLAFAVGVYLPISTSAPVWVGGLIRGLVDNYTRRKHAGANFTEDQLVAEGDKSNGVLLSSGYIAGGTLAGVVFAFLNIPLKDTFDAIEKWATAHNPFFEGPYADLLAMIPFACVLCVAALSRRPRRSVRVEAKVRVAHASRVLAMASGHRGLCWKIVSARRRNQVAAATATRIFCAKRDKQGFPSAQSTRRCPMLSAPATPDR